MSDIFFAAIILLYQIIHWLQQIGYTFHEENFNTLNFKCDH
jgi:hypothetical protein